MPWKLSLSPGTGLQAERYALKYLCRQGLKLEAKNYACKLGEVDLIMMDNNHLVFIEVRYRKSASYGLAEETVNYKKRCKIVAAANHYLLSRKQKNHPFCRYDIVAINGASKEMQVNWIRNAFTG